MSIHPKSSIQQVKPTEGMEAGEAAGKKQNYHSLVEDWANFPAPESASFFLPLDIKAPELFRRKIKAGMCENIASHLKSIQLDVNMDGEFSERELERREEQAKSIIDGYLNLLTNFGVTGALFFSVLIGPTFSEITVSKESRQFFGDDAIQSFKYTFLTLVNASVMFSLLLILRSIQLYKHLSFWMPDVTAQLEWVQEVSTTSTIVTAVYVVLLAFAAVPFGAAITISPGAGLISAICCVCFLLLLRDILYIEEKSELLLHRHARRIISSVKRR